MNTPIQLKIRGHPQMTLDYFYGQSGELFSYFRIPKALFQNHRFRQLSTDARTLYGILLDRMSRGRTRRARPYSSSLRLRRLRMVLLQNHP